MKYFNKIRAIVVAAGFAAAFLTGCLKDKDYENGSIQSNRRTNEARIIEVGVTATSNRNFMVLSLNNSNRDTTLALIPVTLPTSGPAQEDINVKLVQDNAAVAAYNTANGTSLNVPPAAMFTVVNP